jgi:hypothetical protein
VRKDGADPATLEAVDDLEGDLSGDAVADEARDPGRRGIVPDVRDEDVMRCVHAGEKREVGVREPRLGAAETASPRRGAELREDRGHGLHVAVAQRGGS